MPNLNLPTNITPGVTSTFEPDVEAAWSELNELSRDTGLRDVTSLLLNGWTARSVRVRRVRNYVDVEVFDLNGTAATSATMLNMSELGGFAPVVAYESDMFRDSAGDASGYFRVSASVFSCRIGYVSPSSTVRMMRWRCSAAWPSALPGTAVAG